MRPKQAQFIFKPHVCMREVRQTVELSLLASEILHGPERVAIDATWQLSRKRRRVLINTETKVGRTFALTFLGFVRREFGNDAVRICSRPALTAEATCGVTL